MKRTLVVLAVAIAVIGGACGGDDDDDGGGEALTEAEFLAQGNEICAEASADLDAAAGEAFTEEPDPAAVGEFFRDTALPSISDQLDAIEDLEGPDELEEELDSIIADTRDKLEEIEGLDDEELFELVSSGEDPFADINDELVAIGLAGCGDDD